MNSKITSSCYVIAEMACSHEGDPALARTIIDGAGHALADAIQFQIWEAPEIVVPDHSDIEVIRRIELPYNDWQKLAEYTRDHYPSMEIIGCVGDLKSVDFCESINIAAYKIHTSDLSNPHLLRHIAQTGKRIDLSVGASTLNEIQTAIQWIRDISEAEVWLMYGLQIFPTPAHDVHLAYMKKLAEFFEVPVGYQDHTDPEHGGAFWVPCAALGMGVDVLEKHITHDRSKKGIDHQSALNPDEFVRFVEMVRTVEEARGIAIPKPFTEAEQRYRKYSKKSLVAAHELTEGTVLREEDVRILRANSVGLPPSELARLVGRVVQRPISPFEVLTEEGLG